MAQSKSQVRGPMKVVTQAPPHLDNLMDTLSKFQRSPTRLHCEHLPAS